MKNRRHTLAHQSAKIYRHHYQSSFNILKVVKSLLMVLLSGRPVTASHSYRKK